MSRSLPPSWAPAVAPAAIDELVRRLTGAGVTVRRDVPLGLTTSLGVGGDAAALVEPAGSDADPSQLALTLQIATECEVAVLVVGRGSNLLVADSGWPGLALRLGAGFKGYRRSAGLVHAGGAAAMPALAGWLATEGLTGLEFAAGIPGTVGGAVRMNAGAHGGETADDLVDVDIVTAEGDQRTMATADLAFGYRRSSVPTGAVVTAARWQLATDAPAAIRGRLDALLASRRATQPIGERNCGSVFTNPPGDSAGRLVEAAGLKGRHVRGARVSPKHANFIVVEPGTTAADVRQLIAEIRDGVVAAGGPLLEPEVRAVGRFEEPE